MFNMVVTRQESHLTDSSKWHNFKSFLFKSFFFFLYEEILGSDLNRWALLPLHSANPSGFFRWVDSGPIEFVPHPANEMRYLGDIHNIQGVKVNSGKSLSSKFGRIMPTTLLFTSSHPDFQTNACSETNDTSEEGPNIQL